MDNSQKYFYTKFKMGEFEYQLTADDESLLSLKVQSYQKGSFIPNFGSSYIENAIRFKEIRLQLRLYLAGNLRQFDVPIDIEKLKGTSFQKEIWNGLLSIPFAETCSYKELADKLNRPKAYRAVGSANGKNPIPIIIPCHRVIAHNGGLGGYALGLEFKKRLLKLETNENRFFLGAVNDKRN